MRLPLRVWSGLYGSAVHLVVIAAVLWKTPRLEDVPASFWSEMALPFLAAGFVVYAALVGSYLPRRPTHRGVIFFDAAIGMLAELGAVVVTALFYALVASRPELARGLGAYLAAAGNLTLFGFLWATGSFFMQVLIVGNAAGFAGWWVMKSSAARNVAAQGR